MKNRKKIGMVETAAGIVVLLAVGIFSVILDSEAGTIAGAESIYLETVHKSGTIERISINKQQDVKTLKEIFSQEPIRDEGFVFAKGGYRLTFESEEETLRLYPYCGNFDKIRIGEKGHRYYSFSGESENAEKLEEVLGEYCNLSAYQGIYEW